MTDALLSIILMVSPHLHTWDIEKKDFFYESISPLIYDDEIDNEYIDLLFEIFCTEDTPDRPACPDQTADCEG